MCHFNIPFSGDAESLLTRAKQVIEGAGGSFIGSSTSGDFRSKTPLGSIKGSYQIENQVISLTITKKPFLLSCGKIEKRIKRSNAGIVVEQVIKPITT